MRTHKTGKHLDRIASLAAEYLRDAYTATDASELPDAPDDVLRAAVELHEARLRRQVKQLQSDGHMQ